MSKRNVHDDVYSLDERLPRFIPRVEVKLLDQVEVRLGSEVNQLDNYSQIYGEPNLITYDKSDYEASDKLVGDNKSSTKGSNIPTSKPPKWWSQNCAMLGNYLILAPTYDPGNIDTRLVQNSAGDVSDSAAGKSSQANQGKSFERSGCKDTTEVFYTDSGKALWNSWKPVDSSQPRFTETGKGRNLPTRVFAERVKGSPITDTIVSAFLLRKNQPFMIGVNFTSDIETDLQRDITNYWAGNVVKSFLNFPKDDLEFFIPEQARLQSAIIVQWGGDKKGSFTIVFRKDRTISLFRKSEDETTKQLIWSSVATTSFSAAAGNSTQSGDLLQLVIYSIQNQLFMIEGQKLLADTHVGKLTSIEHSFNELLELDESKIKVTFYGGKSSFTFCPIKHPQNGFIQSPTMTVPWVKDKKDTVAVSLRANYVGKFGFDNDFTNLNPNVDVKAGTDSVIGTSSELPIPDPHGQQDKVYSTKYDYLKGKVGLKGELLHNIEESKQKYKLTLSSDPGAEDKRIFSPAVLSTELQVVPNTTTIKLHPDPQIDENDVVRVHISEGPQGSSAMVTLNNRSRVPDGKHTNFFHPWRGQRPVPTYGRYTYVKGKNNFCGVKPIQIKCGWVGEKTDKGETPGPRTHFTGFVTQRRYNRDAPGNSSWCELECEDKSKQLKESYAMNLPLFDGWCTLAVIYTLAKEAGLTDDEILFWQDMVDGKKKIRLVDVIISGGGDPITRQGGCFDGHCRGFPKVPDKYFRSAFKNKINNEYIHATLPSTILDENAGYKFDAGMSIWDCMNKVREYSFFYLYCNHFGNLIYGPATEVIETAKQTIIDETNPSFEGEDMTFVEVDTKKNFNEFQRSLSGTFDTAEMRNSVVVMGLVMSQTKEGVPLWMPQIVVKRQEDWPNNEGDVAFYPWLKWALIRDMRWNDFRRNQLITDELFRRLTRIKANASFSAWGQPGFHPYMVFKIDESNARETGLDIVGSDVVTGCTKYIAAEVSHTLEAQDGYKWDTQINCEYFDEKAILFDPSL
jgi:hypothetical protein